MTSTNEKKSFESHTNDEKIRAALHRDVRAISKETCHHVGFKITNRAMAIIFSLVLQKIKLYGYDLEVFAKHAKRLNINSEDVKVLVRRNPSLVSHLNGICSTMPSTSKRRKSTLQTVRPNTLMDIDDDYDFAKPKSSHERD